MSKPLSKLGVLVNKKKKQFLNYSYIFFTKLDFQKLQTLFFVPCFVLFFSPITLICLIHVTYVITGLLNVLHICFFLFFFYWYVFFRNGMTFPIEMTWSFITKQFFLSEFIIHFITST